MFMVDAVSGAAGVEVMSIPDFDVTVWDGHEAWFSPKQFQFLFHNVKTDCDP